jgi:hypothetical protein
MGVRLFGTCTVQAVTRASAPLIYGALTLVAATAWPGPRRLLVIGGGSGLILAIGVSRLLLNAHSEAEAGLGLVIGVFSLALFSHQYLQGPITKVWPLLVAATVLVSIFYGRAVRRTGLPGISRSNVVDTGEPRSAGKQQTAEP